MSAAKPWLQTYPKGIAAEIDPSRYPSLKALFEASFARFAAKPAFLNHGATMTYSEVDEASRALAAYLQSVARLAPGDRVALMMPNLLQYPIAAAAVLRAGFVVVNVNPLYTTRELAHQLADSGARAIIVLENFADTVEQALEGSAIECVIVTRVGDHFSPLKSLAVDLFLRFVKRAIPAWSIDGAVAYRDVLEEGRVIGMSEIEIEPEDLAFLQYTGGTTGVAKGAMLTHRNIVANVLQAAAWADHFVGGPGDTFLTPLPLYHVFSLTANLLVGIELGVLDVLITDPRDLKGLAAELKAHPASYMTGVNTLFAGLLHTPEFTRLDFSKLKVCMGGGMAVQQAVAEEWQRVTGRALAQGYGLTEASPIVCATPLDARTFNGAVGVPLPSTEVSIRGDENETLPVGEIGEICVLGPQVMAGYWQRPDETARVFDADGWLHTGDMGRMDAAGYVFVEDRKKDMIVVSGFKVYPNEVEDVLVSHPGVCEAAVLGVPSVHSGETVKAFVVRKDPTLTADALIAYCHERLTGYKVPDEIEFRASLPKSNVGKVLRRALRESEHEAQSAEAQS